MKGPGKAARKAAKAAPRGAGGGASAEANASAGGVAVSASALAEPPAAKTGAGDGAGGGDPGGVPAGKVQNEPGKTASPKPVGEAAGLEIHHAAPPDAQVVGFAMQKGQEGVPLYWKDVSSSATARAVLAETCGPGAEVGATSGTYYAPTKALVAHGPGDAPSPATLKSIGKSFPEAETVTYNGKKIPPATEHDAGAAPAKAAPAKAVQPEPAATPTTNKSFDPEKFGGRFESLSETEQWANSAYSPWRKDLNSTQQAALKSYKSTGYRSLNGGLRKNGGDESRLSKHHKDQVRRIDKAIEKAPPLEEPMVVYRGRMPNEVCEAFKKGEENGLVGRVVGDEAYMSTSFKRGTGNNFSHSTQYAASVGKITLPKGTKAAHLESITSMNEAEMLLPRGSKLMITNAYKKDGKNCVDAMLVG